MVIRPNQQESSRCIHEGSGIIRIGLQQQNGGMDQTSWEKRKQTGPLTIESSYGSTIINRRNREVKFRNAKTKSIKIMKSKQRLLHTKGDDQSWGLCPKLFSSWKWFTRVHAWVHHFVDNCRVSNRGSGELSVVVMDQVEN